MTMTTEEKNKYWKCGHCSFLNQPIFTGCCNCGTLRSYKTPPETGRKREESIHTPVIRLMGRFGYGLLKDGDTFYQKGYELNPRIGITFSMKQAYAIQGFMRSAYSITHAEGVEQGRERRGHED